MFRAEIFYAQQPVLKEARLNMGFFYYSIAESANRSDIEVSLNYWAKDLFESEGSKNRFRVVESKSVLYEDMQEMRKDFDAGELDMIVAPPLLIAKYFDRKQLADGVAGVLADKKPEHIYLIANKKKGIKNLKDLVGMNVGMQEYDETADIFLDNLALKELNKSYQDLNLKFVYSKKSASMVLDVFFGSLAAAVVYGSAFDTMVELNPGINSNVAILAEFAFKSKNFSYFRHDYTLAGEINSSANQFNKTIRGKQILEIYKTPEMDDCKLEDLDPIENYYKDYLELKKHAGK
jgi:phosphonate transport system substrate-binding protein